MTDGRAERQELETVDAPQVPRTVSETPSSPGGDGVSLIVRGNAPGASTVSSAARSRRSSWSSRLGRSGSARSALPSVTAPASACEVAADRSAS